ncbi:hypothetical protein [Paeniglutamicibacter psychrophenolicus]|uniref:hypothetical protein n=1 Tax=Paeniglutamicibacter psychrophenolicus TaxID=257454 RepID=UPI002786CFB8|nr:hypothetical protein [Paeniglutamicibacter psychrophenolicus]MDQ0094414.1 hypothetical protein [Paeniglutamicibacter psychrophenolicus]
MSNHTFTPGDTVIHAATDERGTLISTNGVSAVVEWDTTGGKNPAGILPVTDLEPFTAPAAIEAFTDTELEAELQRRRDASYEAARVTAVEYLRETPELATQATTVTQLCRAAIDTGLSPAAMVEAWGIVTRATK